MRMPMHLNFSGHWNIVSGKNCVLERGGQIKRFADRILIVTGKSSAKKSGALDDFETLFRREGIEYAIFEGIEENPHYDTCLRATELCLSFGANGVLGIGGGSPMDAAKTVAAMAANPKITAEDLYARNIPNPTLPVFACPTTAGTGSEVNAYAVLTTGHGEHTRKAGYTNVQAMPAMSFLDAKYTMNLPKTVSLSTAMDASAHAVEAYLHKSSGVFSRMVSMETLRLVWPNFCKLQREELTFEQREQLLFGAALGGLAIDLTGTCFPHGEGYPLTTNFGIPHGFACGYFLPDFLRFHETAFAEEVTALLGAMGLENTDEFQEYIYAVLPKIPNDSDTLEMLILQGKDSPNLLSAIGGGGKERAREIYTTVLKRM